MEEWQALIRRRQMLWERISKMNFEVEKIDQRLDFLGRMALSGQIDQNCILEQFVHEIS